MSIFIPQRLTRQPQYLPRIAGEFQKVTKSAIVGSYQYDVGRNYVLPTTDPGAYGGTLARKATPNGMALYNSGQSYTLGVDAETVMPTGSEVTILLQGYKESQTGPETVLGNITASPAGAEVDIYLPYSPDGNVYWRWGGNSAGTSSLAVGSLAFASDDWWAFTSGPRGMEIWQNGVLKGSNSAGSAVSRVDGSTNLVWGGGSSAGVYWASLSLTMLAVLTKQMDADFLRRRNYWHLFQPQMQRVYSFSTGAGASFQPAWARAANTVISNGARAA